MPLGALLRGGSGPPCPACQASTPRGAVYCPSCGIRLDDPDASPLFVVDRITQLFNERFIKPILDDELTRARRYGRWLGALLFELRTQADLGAGDPDAMRAVASALIDGLREVDTPGVLRALPAQFLVVMPETEPAGLNQASNRLAAAVAAVLVPHDLKAATGLVAVQPTNQVVTAASVTDALARSARAGRPELLGR